MHVLVRLGTLTRSHPVVGSAPGTGWLRLLERRERSTRCVFLGVRRCDRSTADLISRSVSDLRAVRVSIDSNRRGSGGVWVCDMARVGHKKFGATVTIVDHNHNNSLRPNEKMVRSSCMQCHGLQFTLNALADEDLIKNNFQGRPKVHVESLDMAREEKIKSEQRK